MGVDLVGGLSDVDRVRENSRQGRRMKQAELMKLAPFLVLQRDGERLPSNISNDLYGFFMVKQ